MAALTYGPLNKNIFTQQLELVTKCMLYAGHKVGIKVKTENGQQVIHAKFGNVDVNLTNLLKRANFSHLNLNQKDSAQYMKKIGGYSSDNASFYSSSKNYLTPLSPAEKVAITKYSGSEYVSINNLLYGKGAYSSYPDVLQETVLTAVMLGSGLNKIHPATSSSPFSCSYRGESHITYQDIQERIKLIKAGGGVVDSPAFLSTSIDKSVCNAFSTNSMIVFDGVYGKSISDLSYFPSEQEFLLTPGQILWQSYEYQDGKHIFHAKVVAPLIEGKDDASLVDYQNLLKLSQWAQKNGIKADNFTPWLKNELESKQKLVDKNSTYRAVDQGDEDTQQVDSSEDTSASPQSEAPIITLEDHGIFNNNEGTNDSQFTHEENEPAWLDILLGNLFADFTLDSAEAGFQTVGTEEDTVLNIEDVINLGSNDIIPGLDILETDCSLPSSPEVSQFGCEEAVSVMPAIFPIEQLQMSLTMVECVY